MAEWDAATWAQVTIAAVGLVVAVAATLVAWLTYRFTIDSQPIEVLIQKATRPSPDGVIPMVLECASPRVHVHQIWCPSAEGREDGSVPEVVGFEAQDLRGGDVRGFGVVVPDGIRTFDLTVTASVAKRGRVRNVPSPMPTYSMEQGRFL